MKRSLMACGCAVAALAVAACGSSSSSSSTAKSSGSGASSGSASSTSASNSASTSNSPINVLSIGDTSGPTKIYGGLHLAGLTAAATYLNANGGINGRKIVITHLDSGGSAATAVSLAIKALAGSPGKYTMVDAGAEGTEDAALIPIMAKYHQFAITLDDTGGCATASNCPNEFVVKGKPSDPQFTAAAFFKKKGIKKVGILQENIAFTQSETPGIVAALKQAGIASTVVGFPATAVDVTPQLSQLKSAGVQGVFAEALGPPAGYTLAARAKLSWSAPVVFDVAASSLDITKLASPSEVKNAFTDVYGCQNPAGSFAALPTMLKDSPSSYAATMSVTPCDIPGNGWDELIMLRNAAKQAPSLTATALTTSMENLTPAEQTDPMYVTSKVKKYSSSDHQDTAETPSDFVVIGVGPISNAQNHPLGG